MSKIDKAKNRLKTIPKDYKYSEAKTLLEHLGFKEFTKGKTSGSRVQFFREKDNKVILLHKPHPKDEMKIGAVKQLLGYLEEIGEFQNEE